VSVDRKFTKLVDVVTGQQITGQAGGDRMLFDLTLAGLVLVTVCPAAL